MNLSRNIFEKKIFYTLYKYDTEIIKITLIIEDFMKQPTSIALKGIFHLDLSDINHAEQSSRRNASISRSADLLDWQCDKKPEVPSIYDVVSSPIPGATIKRVLFTGDIWMTDSNISKWKKLDVTNDLTAFNFDQNSSQLISRANVPVSLDSWSLEPLESFQSAEQKAVLQLAQREMAKGVNIHVSRVFKPGQGANGIVSGKILATSENYAAQFIGDSDILVHSQDSLNRVVTPGEYLTFEYINGKAQVFNGCLFDVKIDADTLDSDQQCFLRKKIVEALSKFERAPTSDKVIVAATKWALSETIKEFSLDNSASIIKAISVEDTYSKAPESEPPIIKNVDAIKISEIHSYPTKINKGP